jgi:hypothetical protein
VNISDVLIDAFGRVREQVVAITTGLERADLTWRPEEAANSIAWLI